MTAILDTPHIPDYTAGLPRVAVTAGDPGPLPVAVRQVGRGLYAAVVDTSRGLTVEEVCAEIDDHFGGLWITTDPAVLQ